MLTVVWVEFCLGCEWAVPAVPAVPAMFRLFIYPLKVGIGRKFRMEFFFHLMVFIQYPRPCLNSIYLILSKPKFNQQLN